MMVETVNLEHVPSRILQNITETPKTIQIKGEDAEYSTITKKVEIKTLNSYNGSSDNLLITEHDRILFANTYNAIKLFDKINAEEFDSVLSVIFNKVLPFRFEEDISIFHLDKALSNTKNLVKISELPKLDVDYIISSNRPVILNISHDLIQCVSDGISINRLNEFSIRELLINELNNSVVLVKINNTNSVDIGNMIKKMYQFSNIIRYDRKNQIFAIKLIKLADVGTILLECASPSIIRPLIQIDRTNWLASTFS